MRLLAAGWLVDGLCRTISAILDIYCSRQRPTLIWMGAIENVTICKYLWRFPDIFDIVSRRGVATQWLICVQIHTTHNCSREQIHHTDGAQTLNINNNYRIERTCSMFTFCKTDEIPSNKEVEDKTQN